MKSINIVIAESSDLLYGGIMAILYQSEHEYNVTRLLSFEEIEETLTNKSIEVLIINPILMFGNSKGVKRLKRNHPQLLIGSLNMNILDTKPLMVYDININIYDSSSQILSVINNQLNLKQLDYGDRQESEILSDRETEVLLQLIKGHTNKEIADILYISVHTVISHRRNIMIKTGIRSQAGLALYAVSKSLISLDDFDL